MVLQRGKKRAGRGFHHILSKDGSKKIVIEVVGGTPLRTKKDNFRSIEEEGKRE